MNQIVIFEIILLTLYNIMTISVSLLVIVDGTACDPFGRRRVGDLILL